MAGEKMKDLGQQVIHGRYQAHIDGLRAVAVIPVLLFHLNESLAPGGFVGVDVFFVISGFLITGGILRDLENGKFSLKRFYDRRVRRIIPAYLTVVGVTLAISMALYTHRALEAVSKTAFSSAALATNLRFWSNNDYFAPAAQEDPLLHMWSLGVEEQFYIIIPLLMWACFRKSALFVNQILGVCFFASLGLACWQVANENFRDAFYFPHSRAWELLAGSLMACILAKRDTRASVILATVGLVMVFASLVLYSPLTEFPGASALLPVIGASLLIRFGHVGWVGLILSSRPLVLVGRVSYSLYLWHWPMIVFWRYVTFGRFEWYDQMGALLVSSLMAWLSWRWVEIPVRLSTKWSPRKSLCIVVAGCFSVAVLTAAIFKTDGAKNWLNVEANATVLPNAVPKEFKGTKLHIGAGGASPEWSQITADQLNDMTTTPPALIPIGEEGGSPSFVLWGDSHAAAIIVGMHEEAKKAKQSGFFLNRQHGMLRWRAPFFPEVVKWLKSRPDIETVVIVQRWATRLGDPKMRELLRDTCRQLSEARKRVLLFEQPAEFAFDPTQYLAKAMILGMEPKRPVVSIEQHHFLQRHSRALFRQLEEKNWATVLPFNEVFRDGDEYLGVQEGVLMYMDSNHLSPEGGATACEFIAPLIWPDGVARPAGQESKERGKSR